MKKSFNRQEVIQLLDSQKLLIQEFMYRHMNELECVVDQVTEVSYPESFLEMPSHSVDVDSIKKENKTSPGEVVNWMDVPIDLKHVHGLHELWLDFLSERNKRKKPVSNTAAKRIWKRLLEHKHEPKVIIEMLENSIISGWTGVFEVKAPSQDDKKARGKEQTKFQGKLTS